MSKENRNRLHDIAEKRLIDELEKECRKLPKPINLPPTLRFKEVTVFSPAKRIHEILTDLDRIRASYSKLVPTSRSGES